jgi:hypothetical protein
MLKCAYDGNTREEDRAGSPLEGDDGTGSLDEEYEEEAEGEGEDLDEVEMLEVVAGRFSSGTKGENRGPRRRKRSQTHPVFEYLCDHCHRDPVDRVCAGCGVARFCSDRCFRAYSKAGHREKCVAHGKYRRRKTTGP